MERGLLVGDCWAYREFHTWQRVANCLASPRMVDPHSLLTHYVGTLFPENKPGQAQFPYLPGAKWQDKESKTPEDFFLSVDGPYKSLKLREYWPKKNPKQNKTKKNRMPLLLFSCWMCNKVVIIMSRVTLKSLNSAGAKLHYCDVFILSGGEKSVWIHHTGEKKKNFSGWMAEKHMERKNGSLMFF